MSGSEADAEDQAPRPESIEKWRWAQIRDPVRPEPDGKPEVNYACAESIAQRFKETGLQVVVKMARIELTPEKPDFPAGGWHVSPSVLGIEITRHHTDTTCLSIKRSRA